MRVPQDTIDFMRGLPGFLATRDAANRPTAVEGALFACDPESGIAEVMANARFAREMLANLRDNGSCAFVVSRVWADHRSAQFKGRCLEVTGPVLEPDGIGPLLEGLAVKLGEFGVSREVADHYRDLKNDLHYRVRMQVEQLFDQTPGPGAGRPAT